MCNGSWILSLSNTFLRIPSPDSSVLSSAFRTLTLPRAALEPRRRSPFDYGKRVRAAGRASASPSRAAIHISIRSSLRPPSASRAASPGPAAIGVNHSRSADHLLLQERRTVLRSDGARSPGDGTYSPLCPGRFPLLVIIVGFRFLAPRRPSSALLPLYLHFLVLSKKPPNGRAGTGSINPVCRRPLESRKHPDDPPALRHRDAVPSTRREGLLPHARGSSVWSEEVED